MIQLVINTNMLREINERRLIRAYARFMYNTEEDVTNDVNIRNNLIQLFDWDVNGDRGLKVYCSKFESIKRKDWDRLIQFIKENHYEIELLSRPDRKERKLKSEKIIDSVIQARELHNKERFTDENYTISGRGRKARPCVYEGREYKSRMECLYKEKLTKRQLHEYLKKTNQI